MPPAQRIEPTPEERARLAKAPTRSLEAQEAFGRGLVSYKRGQFTEAAREFERATSIDSDYVEVMHSRQRRYAVALAHYDRALRLEETVADGLAGAAWTGGASRTSGTAGSAGPPGLAGVAGPSGKSSARVEGAWTSLENVQFGFRRADRTEDG